MPAEFYTRTLYPLQDQVLSLFGNSPFYLTGGTALSRGYYQHRYSDDLDFFVNAHNDFERLLLRHISLLRKQFTPFEVAIRDDSFCRLFVGRDQLKIEFINDVPSHIGTIIEHPVLGRLDSRENILANKLTALADRAHPKDVADIYYLLNDGLSIKQALTDADSKAAGITPLLIAKMLGEYNYNRLSSVKWINPPNLGTISSFLHEQAIAILEGV